jgi:hypothetical protein
MPIICRRKGCRKQASLPLTCLTHTRAAVSEDKTVKPNGIEASLRKRPSPRETYCRLPQFVCLLRIRRHSLRLHASQKRQWTILRVNPICSGRASAVDSVSNAVADPLLQLMIEEAKQKVKFPLKSKCQVLHPSIVVAPEVAAVQAPIHEALSIATTTPLNCLVSTLLNCFWMISNNPRR